MPAPTTYYQPYAEQHKEVTGPEDARPTALQIVKDLGLTGKLNDKVILITGASAGLGVEAARALYTTGAKLFLTFRDRAKGEAVVKKIVGADTTGQTPELIELELGSLESVRGAAKQFLSKSNQLNILINNAGIMAVPEGTTAEGFERQLGSNHFGHFLLFHLLKSTLLASSTPDFPSRVVNLSSGGHKISGIQFDDLDLKKQGYNSFIAYGQSKTANIYMANSIERHYGSKGLRGLSLHPGVIWTELTREMSQEELAYIEGIVQGAKSTEQGAATTVFAALSPHFNEKGGVYLADVGVSGPSAEGEAPTAPGYAPYAYDEEAEEKLWKISLEAVGVADDE